MTVYFVLNALHKSTCCAFLLCLMCRAAFAQEQQEYEKWKKKQQQEMQKFIDERDKAFTEFLKQEWKEMKAMEGLVADEKPKPTKLPSYSLPADTLEPKEHDSYNKVTDITISEIGSEKKPDLDINSVGINSESNNIILFDFFGDTLKLNYDKRLLTQLILPINEDAISNFWSIISKSNYEDIIKQANYYKTNLRLIDWGYCILLKKIGDVLFRDSKNESSLFVWFILTKSGYKVKIGYENDNVYLLISSENNLYGVPYFQLGEVRENFYAVSLDSSINRMEGSIFTYDGIYPGSDIPLKFNIDKLPILRSYTEPKKLKFNYGDMINNVVVNIDKAATDFFRYYPQTDLDIYFGASISTEAGSSLLNALCPLILGKSEVEAANILLRFVQTAFSYKTDNDQFGREKPMFPDETLYYSYSDCEDRSILFAYLVKNLLGLKVIGLDYPSHIATAVKFTDVVSGDHVKYQNDVYTICDPTYENANAGVCMPQFRDVVPEVIRVQ